MRPLRVLTYNVAATPQNFGQAVTLTAPNPWRFKDGHIANRLEPYDVVGLTEMFVPDSHRMRDGLTFATKEQGPPGRAAAQPLSAGLELCARLPRADGGVHRRHYADRGLRWDQFAAKGVLLVRLEVPGGHLLVATTHLQSGDGPDETRRRRTQLLELHEAIETVAEDDALLILGDLNVDGNEPRDQGYALLRRLFSDCRDAALEAGATEPTWDPASNPLATGIAQRLDFILYRSGPTVRLHLDDARVAMTEPVQGTPLSDHFGLEARFQVETRPPARAAAAVRPVSLAVAGLTT